MNVVEPENVFGLRPPVLMVILGSLVLGGFFFAIGYIVIKLGRRTKKHVNENSAEEEIPKTEEDTNLANSETGPGTNNAMTNSKRARKKRREAQQEFNHSWVVGALKGHTAPVQDINFSSNGKFLASCAEDCGLAPEEKLDLVKSSKSKPSTTSSSRKEPEEKTPLSRRQRKNRTRAPREKRKIQELNNERKENPSNSPTMNYNQILRTWPLFPAPVSHPPRSTGMAAYMPNFSNADPKYDRETDFNIPFYSPVPLSRRKLQFRYMLGNFTKANAKKMLQSYVLSSEQLIHGGFPVALDDDANSVVVYCFGRHHQCSSMYPVKANRNENDSGNGSESSLENSDHEHESSSDSDKCSDTSESSTNSSRRIVPCILPGPVNNVIKSNPSQVRRRCMRCSQFFSVDAKTGEHLKAERCVHHWGKRRSSGWECCARDLTELGYGCTSATSHVWTEIVPQATNGPLEGYVVTESSKDFKAHVKNSHGVYAIDCEMGFTKKGLELLKVSMVDLEGDLIYETFVKPEGEVIDYNTRFSGISAEDMEGVTTRLQDVQEHILQFVNSETILIGHGLENDLRALKIVHKRVIDTSFVFNADWIPLYRRSLKDLALSHLQKVIQVDHHDSAEDARVALELMLTQLKDNCLYY